MLHFDVYLRGIDPIFSELYVKNSPHCVGTFRSSEFPTYKTANIKLLGNRPSMITGYITCVRNGYSAYLFTGLLRRTSNLHQNSTIKPAMKQAFSWVFVIAISVSTVGCSVILRLVSFLFACSSSSLVT